MKGKYGKRAIVRKEASEQEASEQAYRRQIVRLTQERDAARCKLDELHRIHRLEVRELQTRIDEAVSPRVIALSHELEKFRTKCDRYERDRITNQKRQEKQFNAIINHFVTGHGMTGLEAVEYYGNLTLADDKNIPHITINTANVKGSEDDTDAIRKTRAIQLSRRERKST